MTAVVLLKDASRARWLRARTRRICATDVPALFNQSQWRTPLSVWLDKVTPQQPRDAATYVQARGHALEPLLARTWAESNGAVLEKPPALLGHPDYPHVACSLDYLAHHRDSESVVVECKTASKWEEWADGDLPDMYATQARVQAAVTGLPVVIVADVNSRVEVRRIDPDPDWEAQALPWLEDWWATFVATRTPPPLHEWRDYPLLNRVWLPEPGVHTDADEQVMGAAAEYLRLGDRMKADGITREALKTTIRAHMGTATVLDDPDTGRKVASITKNGALTFSKPEGEAS